MSRPYAATPSRLREHRSKPWRLPGSWKLHRLIAMFPAWISQLFIADLGSGRQQLLGNFDGITLSPRFSPDGGSVIMAQTNSSGGSVIMTVSLGGGGARRLTDGSAIDVSPCYS